MSPKFINPRSIFSLFLTSKVRLERSRVYIVVVVVVQLLGLYAETGRGRRRIRASVVCEDVLRIGGFISSRSASVCVRPSVCRTCKRKKKDTVQIRGNKTDQEGGGNQRSQTLCVSFFLSLLFLVFYIRTSRQSIIAQKSL